MGDYLFATPPLQEGLMISPSPEADDEVSFYHRCEQSAAGRRRAPHRAVMPQCDNERPQIDICEAMLRSLASWGAPVCSIMSVQNMSHADPCRTAYGTVCTASVITTSTVDADCCRHAAQHALTSFLPYCSHSVPRNLSCARVTRVGVPRLLTTVVASVTSLVLCVVRGGDTV